MTLGTHKAVAKALKQARKAGATVRMTGSGHFQVRTPNGGVTHVSVTPRNGEQTAKRLLKDLRKLGLRLDK